MRIRCTAVTLTIASLLTIGCGRTPRSPEPVPVDRVECARCRMLISTEQGAAQIVSAREDTRFYDDVACLAADWPQHDDGARPFVRVVGGSWIDATAAFYARPAAARTAMGSAIVVFATADEARAADRAARVMTWNDVLELGGGDR